MNVYTISHPKDHEKDGKIFLCTETQRVVCNKQKACMQFAVLNIEELAKIPLPKDESSIPMWAYKTCGKYILKSHKRKGKNF